MKSLVITLILCCISNVSALTELVAPKILSLTALEPAGYHIKWGTVPYDEVHPITGYTVRLWTVEEDSSGFFILINGDEVPGVITNVKILEPYDLEKPPKYEPREVLISGVNTRQAKIYDIKYNKLYEIRVSARKMNEEGPLSKPIRMKILKGDGYYTVLQRNPQDSCLVSVLSNVTVDGETYPQVENINF